LNARGALGYGVVIPVERGASRGARWRKVRLQFLALAVYELGAAIGGLTHLRLPGLVSALPLVAVAAVVAAAPAHAGDVPSPRPPVQH
jgi:hypothetical protein